MSTILGIKKKETEPLPPNDKKPVSHTSQQLNQIHNQDNKISASSKIKLLNALFAAGKIS